MKQKNRIFQGAAIGAVIGGGIAFLRSHPAILAAAAGAAVLYSAARPSAGTGTQSPRPPEDTPPQALSDVPDQPQSFGYKVCWAAIRSDSSKEVARALGFADPVPANWASGIAAAYERDERVFFSPPVDGYVLVVGLDSNPDVIPLLERAARSFDDVQYYGSHRVVDYSCWAKYWKGELVRAYCFVGDQGEVEWDEGTITTEECALGFDRFPLEGEEWGEGTDFPTEESVLQIAGVWGVNPATLGEREEPGVGLLCRKP